MTPARRGAEPPTGLAPGLDGLLQGLRQALRQARLEEAECPLALLSDKGLAHHHVRLLGSGLLARLPKQSQMGLPVRQNLAYEAACFRRAAPSGHVPQLAATLPPGAHLPRGGLLVEEVVGRPARLPDDLTAIAAALAAIHALPLPRRGRRQPLLDDDDPLQALQREIAAQAVHLDSAGLDAGTRALIGRAQARFHACLGWAHRPARRLIAFDAHPGNFLLRDDGRAVLVDLEKARYSHPPLDLAHATLYTSTTWDIASNAALNPQQVAATYAAWESASDLGRSQRRWMLPLRAAMWLWSITWCAKWRALSPRQASATADGEDWSQSLTAQALVRHVHDRVDCYLSRPIIERVSDELNTLDRWLGD